MVGAHECLGGCCVSLAPDHAQHVDDDQADRWTLRSALLLVDGFDVDLDEDLLADEEAAG